MNLEYPMLGVKRRAQPLLVAKAKACGAAEKNMINPLEGNCMNTGGIKRNRALVEKIQNVF